MVLPFGIKVAIEVAGMKWQEHSSYGRHTWPMFLINYSFLHILLLATCSELKWEESVEMNENVLLRQRAEYVSFSIVGMVIYIDYIDIFSVS